MQTMLLTMYQNERQFVCDNTIGRQTRSQELLTQYTKLQLNGYLRQTIHWWCLQVLSTMHI